MPFPLLSQAALKQCTISELKKGTKGQQYAEIRFADETPVFQLSAEPLLSPFSAGVFQDDGSATRLNWDLNLNEATKNILEASCRIMVYLKTIFIQTLSGPPQGP